MRIFNFARAQAFATSFLLLAFSTLQPSLHAQITLTSADLPQAGMTYERATSPVSLDATTGAGPNSTWDFSDLGATVVDETAFFGMSSASVTIQFSFTSADHFTAFVLPEFDGLDLPVSGATVIWDYTSSAYTTVGIGISTEFIDLPVAYVDADETLPLPLTYGATLDDDSQLELDIPTQLYYGNVQNRVVEVDGWGSLILPGGTFDVLRVKTVITGSDSINIPAAELGFSIPKNQTIYAWYAPGEGTPVLSIVEIADIPLLASFKTGGPVSSIYEANSAPFSVVGPVPARDYVVLSGVQAGQVLQVLDAMGRFVRSSTVDANLGVQLGGLAKGAYFLKMNGSAARSIGSGQGAGVRILVD